jgi:hypothetical protein
LTASSIRVLLAALPTLARFTITNGGSEREDEESAVQALVAINAGTCHALRA